MTLDSQAAGDHRVPASFTLNGKHVETAVEPRTMLVDLLRNEFGLTGTKRSCDMQVCGACTVLLNGLPVSGCTVPAFEARGKEVLTIEGLTLDGNSLHPLMKAFAEGAALQCGYCTPGMVLAASALLDENSHPTDSEIIEFMRGNLCRCTGYKKIVEAIKQAAESPSQDE